MSERQNLRTIVRWLDAMRRRDVDQAMDSFAAGVTWEGVAEGVACHDKGDVREMLDSPLLGEAAHALELIARGDRVVLGVRSPDIEEIGGVSLEGQLYTVFELVDGEIVRAHDYARRAEALAAAAIGDAPIWR
ncbi:MAG TPA: nuclear transport factor 2 family protein [Solirubrobacterales bacterium]|nr:nuclear transport factor 2 family protein [Solirubrobacterales bacterium]